MEQKGQTKASRLRELLATRTVGIPGAFNALIAMQIEKAGYETVYVSGAALSACRGIPDTGLLTLSDVAAEAGRIAQAVSIPAIVDADTGYGGPMAVREAVTSFERAGLAGMQIEDQEMAKKCGHLSGKRLIPVAEMASKIEEAARAKIDRDFMIIARTDARGVEGLEATITRAATYAEAGADALFPEALESADEFQTFAKEVKKAGIALPLIANMTEFGKTPLLSCGEFETMGYRGVLFPVTTLRTALRAIGELLAELKLFGTQRDWLHHMMTRQELYDLLRYTESLERREGRMDGNGNEQAGD
ncbi:2-methylisocitrate lyase [Nitrospira sp. KM1]|uniref:methylisocitrate lyase n=1 Tax=Nitrospira sp. KM1 TaxID=1936990 RepID=UPI0013A7B0D4|nr:methylisocitrate lyase [Nitrospira sp. KM1]BCA53353.1 2-methylisocitrate lyase [Nitrospira sp. KM1]